MATVLASVVTFLGTLLVAAIGFWQWRRTQSAASRERYRAERIETLAEVWRTLNEMEDAQRQEVVSGDIYPDDRDSAQVRAVNILMMRSAPFLMDDEQAWAVRIVQNILQIDAALRVSTELAREETDWWVTSVADPGPSVQGIAARAAYDLKAARKCLGDRYAAVMRGDHE